jgi:hypothetical protein
MDTGNSEHTAHAGDAPEPGSSEFDEGSWSISTSDDNIPALGFLQMCVERRFYRAIQEEFEKLTGLSHYEYWIHTDAGGSPKMTASLHKVAPDYCYKKQEVRIMGWAAHGTGCGGYDPPAPDHVIHSELIQILNLRVDEYPKAEHYAFFAIENEITIYPPGVKMWSRGPIRKPS